MLLVILALFWVAILAPLAVKRLRDRGTERSIESFHAEHQSLSRHQTVAPAHRLDADMRLGTVKKLLTRTRPIIVHADDTPHVDDVRDYEDFDDYDYEPSNRYAAYAATPRTDYRAAAPRSSSATFRRRRVFTATIGAALFFSVLDFVASGSFFFDLAIISWLSVVVVVAMTFYSISQGWMSETSLGFTLPKLPTIDVARLRETARMSDRLATIRQLHAVEDLDDEYEDEHESEFFEAGQSWNYDEQPRRAIG